MWRDNSKSYKWNFMKFYRQMEPVGVHRCIVFRDLMFKIALARWKKPVKITQNVQKVPLLFNILLFWQQIWIPQAKTSGKDPSNVSLAQLERLLCQKTYLVTRYLWYYLFFQDVKTGRRVPRMIPGAWIWNAWHQDSLFNIYMYGRKKIRQHFPPSNRKYFFF